MAAKATYIGIDKIVSAFENKADTPFFSIWVGKTRCEQNKENDFDVAKEKIERQVKDFLEGDFNEVFIIALHPEKKVSYKVEDQKEATLLYCQAQKNDVAIFHPTNNYNYEILNKLNAMESKINALEAEEIEEEETETISGDEAILGRIENIISSPLVNTILGLIFKDGVKSPALASNDTDELSTILTTLFQKGVTVAHLKKLSEYPANKIQMLLSMM